MDWLERIKAIPSKNEIKGSFGEWIAKTYSNLATNALILHDVLIDGAENRTSQIDMVMIGNKGIFVVEVKTYVDAKIYGDGKKDTWYYYLGGNKYEIYSPLKQNKKHSQYLKNFLSDFGDLPMYSVVLLICDSFKVSNINDNSNSPDTVICSNLPSMLDGIQLLLKGKQEVISDDLKKEIYEYIAENQYSSKEKRLEHKKGVKEYQKSLKEQKDKKLCPYCGAELKLRNGQYGEFYGCSNYPKCKYTQKI